jgi:hypothetical protein
MAKVTEVGVTLGMTLNIGNFESMRIDAECKMMLEPEDTPESAYSAAWAHVQNQIREHAKVIREKQKKTTKE